MWITFALPPLSDHVPRGPKNEQTYRTDFIAIRRTQSNPTDSLHFRGWPVTSGGRKPVDSQGRTPDYSAWRKPFEFLANRANIFEHFRSVAPAEPSFERSLKKFVHQFGIFRSPTVRLKVVTDRCPQSISRSPMNQYHRHCSRPYTPRSHPFFPLLIMSYHNVGRRNDSFRFEYDIQNNLPEDVTRHFLPSDVDVYLLPRSLG